MKGLIILLMLAMIAGCASSNGHLPDHALKDPADGISIPNPVEYERQGRKVMTMFKIVMDPGLWTEVIAGGGVWPIVGAAHEDDNEKLYRGYCYLDSPNYWGDFLLNCLLNYPEADLQKALAYQNEKQRIGEHCLL